MKQLFAGRHWSLFLGIWGFAALAPIILFFPIFSRTFYMHGANTSNPDVYLDFLEADMMGAAIGAILMVALVQTFLPAVNRMKRVFVPQIAVWGVLGLSLAIVGSVQPLPPPLRTTLGEATISVPQTFVPQASSRYVPAEKRSYPMFRFRVCDGTAEPAYRVDCESVPIEIDTDRGIGAAFPARIPDAAYALYLAENNLSTWKGTGAIVDEGEGFVLVQLPETPASDRDWVTTSYVTFDRDAQPKRFAGCWGEGKCFVATETRFGVMTYQTPPGASQRLVDREAYETSLMQRISEWQH